jgi:transposase-like protein
MVLTYLKKRIKPDMPEAVIKEAVRAVQERKYSVRVAASRCGITHTTLYYRILNIQPW